MRDRQKVRANYKRWYDKNKATEVKRIHNRKKIWTKFIRKWLYEKKLEIGFCSRCGFSDPRALQWHHRDPDNKKFNLAEAGSILRSIKTVQEEVNKCDLLCANCHFIEHFQGVG